MLATEQKQNDRFLFINQKYGQNKEKFEIDLVMFTYYGNSNVLLVNIRRLNGAYLYLER